MDPTSDTAKSFTPPLPSLVNFEGASLYLTGEANLRVTVFNSGAGVTVTVTGRMLAFGETRPSPFKQTFTPATDRSASTTTIPLDAGWLLNCQAVVSAGSPALGQTFVRASIVHGLTSNADEVSTLFADYITAKQPASFPGSVVTDPTDGAGAVRSITGSNPGAGAEITEVVPTGARWELLTFEFVLTTAVAVANRVVALFLDDGATDFWRGESNTNQAASLAVLYSHSQGFSAGWAGIAGTQHRPLPMNIRLKGGQRIRTSTGAIQAADQYSFVQYLVREWIEGA